MKNVIIGKEPLLESTVDSKNVIIGKEPLLESKEEIFISNKGIDSKVLSSDKLPF